ncbi:MAG: CotH kinase family protein, partial [Flavobacteriales bacterium]
MELHLLSSFDNSLVNLPQPFLSSNPRTFVLRNGGEDGFFEGKSGIRNALGATMFNSIQSSRKQQIPSPIHVFINHSYFGLYWMYQKINENALPEAKMVLKRSSKSVNTRKAFKGSWESYEEQELALLQITDTSSSFLSQFGSTWDTDNFIAYHFFQQFIGNQDRFSNNLKVWQSKKDHLWRYLLWDIDWGYGLWDSISPSGSPKWNALAFQLSDNAGWTKTSETQLFQHAMKNDDFKNLFITRSFDYLNFECSEENHLKVIQNLTKTIENNLDQQFQLYKGNFSSWQNELAKIENYVHQRHQHHSIHLAQFIQDSLVELNLTQNHRSTILINGKQLNNEELIYPSNCKLHLLPLRKDEESFLMWSDSITLLSRWVTAKGSLPYPLYTASKNEDQLVISEVNTAPNYSSRKEHLEISNSSNLPVLLYGYSISDGNNTQHFQIDDFIEPQSTKRFDHLDFKLNKNGEELV